MKPIYLISILAASTLLTGCAKWNSTGISYLKGSTGRVMLYSSDYTAAVGRDNALCVQGAQTASASAFNGAIDLVGKLRAGGGFGQSIVVLNPSSPQTTFARDAFFNVCQLAMNSRVNADGSPSNDPLTGAQIVAMFSKAADTAVQISNSPSDVDPFTSPELMNFVQSVLAENGVEKTVEEVEQELRNAATEGNAESEQEPAPVSN